MSAYLSNLPPGVTDADLEPAPCRCDNDCRCLCEHGLPVVSYQPQADPQRWQDDGVAEDGCIILCRCGDGTCRCTVDDWEPPNADYNAFRETAYREA